MIGFNIAHEFVNALIIIACSKTLSHQIQVCCNVTTDLSSAYKQNQFEKSSIIIKTYIIPRQQHKRSKKAICHVQQYFVNKVYITLYKKLTLYRKTNTNNNHSKNDCDSLHF